VSLQLPEEKMPVTVYKPVVYLASGRASGHLKDFFTLVAAQDKVRRQCR